MDWRNWNNVADVSSFMLFESTGDSEADSDLNMVPSLSDDNMEVTYELDDAQSCCSDSSESMVQDYNDHHDQEYAQFSNKKKEQHHAHYDYNPRYRDHKDDDEEEEEDDEDDGAIDQDWTNGKDGFVFSRKKISTMEPMKEEEKDKLFWETCLAS